MSVRELRRGKHSSANTTTRSTTYAPPPKPGKNSARSDFSTPIGATAVIRNRSLSAGRCLLRVQRWRGTLEILMNQNLFRFQAEMFLKIQPAKLQREDSNSVSRIKNLA